MSNSFAIVNGDVMAALKEMESDSYHGCLTDPPYHLTQASRGGSPRTNNPETPFGRTKLGSAGFMGKTWDGGDIAFRVELWAEVFRVLKPGAMLLAFGGTRTHHRLMCAVEDAGFEIRDCCMWLYGSGFPKSLDISKAIDKKPGAERQVVGRTAHPDGKPRSQVGRESGVHAGGQRLNGVGLDITAPATEAAAAWNGYGTALKPAWAPIILAMKPLDKTFSNNALTHGVAGLNIDGSRIASGDDHKAKCESVVGLASNRNGNYYSEWNGERESSWNPDGRWPSNVLLDEAAATLLDEQSGSTSATGNRSEASRNASVDGTEWYVGNHKSKEYPGESGGASRFFYVAKANSSERHASGKNSHPCVKPIDLTSYLAKLILPPSADRRLLVPFSGSGSEIIGALRAGWTHVLGIEGDKQYVEFSKVRVRDDAPLFNGVIDFTGDAA